MWTTHNQRKPTCLTAGAKPTVWARAGTDTSEAITRNTVLTMTHHCTLKAECTSITFCTQQHHELMQWLWLCKILRLLISTSQPRRCTIQNVYLHLFTSLLSSMLISFNCNSAWPYIIGCIRSFASTFYITSIVVYSLTFDPENYSSMPIHVVNVRAKLHSIPWESTEISRLA